MCNTNVTVLKSVSTDTEEICVTAVHVLELDAPSSRL